MASLKELQTALQSYMLNGDESIAKFVISTKQVPAKKRLDIYRNGYFWRLLEILNSDYTILKKWLGTKAFELLAERYVKAHPSKYFSVRPFGKDFASFIQQDEQLQAQAELAAIEWTLTEIQDAADADPIVFEDMVQIPPESWPYAQFTLHPSLRLLTCNYNAPDIWKALTQSKRRHKTKQYNEPVVLRVWRYQEECYFAPMNEAEHAMLKACMDKATFGEICELLYDYLPEEAIAQFAGGTLRTWVAEGLVTGIELIEIDAEEEAE